MKHKKRHGSEEDESSSEDERIIEEEPFEERNDEYDNDKYEEDLFENSQDLTQVVPRSNNNDDTLRLESSPSPSKSKKKKKKDKNSTREESSPLPVDNDGEDEFENYAGNNGRSVSGSTGAGRRNGFRVREVDTTEIPEHILKGLKRLLPKESDSTEGLTAEDWDACKSDEEGGVWILQCPKDVDLNSVITGKKLSLNGKKSILGGEDDDDADLTQYAPTSSLGANISKRKFEAVSVSNEQYREGVALLLPDNSSFRLVTAPVQGHIIIRKSLKDLLIPKVEVPEPKPRELPSGIKERHPVYGSDFTQILKEMDEAPVKKRKKKKSLPEEPEPKLGPPKFIKLTLNGHSNNHNEVNDNSGNDEDDSFAKKKKKKKKDKYKNEEDSFTDQSSLHIKEESEETPTKSKKKSKKRKRDDVEEPEDSKEHLQSLLDCDMPTVKRSKKSKHHG